MVFYKVLCVKHEAGRIMTSYGISFSIMIDHLNFVADSIVQLIRANFC